MKLIHIILIGAGLMVLSAVALSLIMSANGIPKEIQMLFWALILGR